MGDDMVVIDGVRYRAEDAKRLGLITDVKMRQPKNKARVATTKVAPAEEVKES